eukprot:g10051.t1
MEKMAARERVLGIVGATGAVGLEMLKVLAARSGEKSHFFPPSRIKLYASKRSAGKQLPYKPPNASEEVLLTVSEFSVEKTIVEDKVEVLLLASSGDFAKEFVPLLLAKKEEVTGKTGMLTIIDNSSAFRYEKTVPLVIIANPIKG